MILGSDVQQVFKQLFEAHREAAIAEERVTKLKLELEQAERDVEACQSVVRELNGKMNRMAREAGGISERIPDENPRRSEFIPVRR